MEKNLISTVKNAKEASYTLANCSEELKNKALMAIADAIEDNKEKIFSANNEDLTAAQALLNSGQITSSAFGRLKLDENKMRDMIQGIRDVAMLEDPVNKKTWAMELDEGLELYKVTCPIGLLAVIFEARPDVIAQISSLCIKSGNAVLLKGGKEGTCANSMIASIINNALERVAGFPKNVINLLFTRDEVTQLLSLDDYISLIIPRGSNAFVKYIKQNTNIPVLGHAEGICHIYVDAQADFKKALDISLDSKIQYPSACNAVETILINEDILADFLPKLVNLFIKNGVRIKADEICRGISDKIEPATEEDWSTEYGDKIISVKAVRSVKEAIKHINHYGSGHTDCIITENVKNAELFMNLVDSAGVYKNASTRFADGFRYGLGAEVGISTNKTHARGPVGLEGLVIYKYKLYGSGQTAGDYCSGEKHFTHKRLI